MRYILTTIVSLMIAFPAFAACPNYNSEEGRKASITADENGNNCYGNPVVDSDPGRDAQDRQNAKDTE